MLPPSSALLIADLTPTLGRQNHTTSPSASAPFVTCAARVHRIPPRVRDDRDTPLKWDETARLSELICLRCEGKYFCKRGWTGHFGKHEVICPSGKISTVAGSESYSNRGFRRVYHRARVRATRWLHPAMDSSRCGRQWLVAELPVLRNCFRFKGIADMAGSVAGTARSRMT